MNSQKKKGQRLVIAIIGLGIVLVTLKGWFSGEQQEQGELNDYTLRFDGSNDTLVETLQALTAQVRLAEKTSEQLMQDNAEIKARYEEDRATLSNHLTAALKKELANDYGEMARELERLKKQWQEKPSTVLPSFTENETGEPMPTIPNALPRLIDDSLSINDEETGSWFDSAPLTPSTAPVQEEWEEKEVTPIPKYTIPVNATAVDVTLMSALIGRIPIEDKVHDPYPFKVLLGQDVLAANGLFVPDIEGIVASGYSKGDMLFSCARGVVTSLTFVFIDGTIQTIESSTPASLEVSSSLGWISDSYGNPCVKGQFITNAPMVVGTKVGLGIAKGAADAYAQMQTSAMQTNQGNVVRDVTGSHSAFLAGKAASSAAESIESWWEARVKNSFDAVYVPANETIVVHFTKAIHIDYDPEGRKTVYVDTTPL